MPNPTENATAARRIEPCPHFDPESCTDRGLPRCEACQRADAFTALLDEHDRQRDAALAAVAEFSAKALRAAFADLARAQEAAETLRAERDAWSFAIGKITHRMGAPLHEQEGALKGWKNERDEANRILRNIVAVLDRHHVTKDGPEALEARVERTICHHEDQLRDVQTELWRWRFCRAFAWFGPGPTGDKHWVNRALVAESALAAQTTEVARLRAALEWYEDYARALSQDLPAQRMGAVLASTTALSLDGGQRARAALRPPTADEAGGAGG